MIAVFQLDGSIAYKTLRVAEFCVGLFLLCMALFLYEDENGKIQNTLETWWIRLKDQQDSAPSRQAAFMKGVARLTTDVFDKLFGQRLISIRALGTSLCLSYGTFALFWVNNGIRSGRFDLIFTFSLIAVADIAFGLMPLRIKGKRKLQVWFLAALAQMVAIPWLTAGQQFISYRIFLLLSISLACDICFVWATRKMIRWIKNKSSFSTITAIVLVNCGMARYSCWGLGCSLISL